MSALRAKLTYANVVSTLALLLALGMGSAYAANQLAPKSVGERQLRPGAVTADKIRKSAVTAPKIKAEAVKQGKLANGAISSQKLAEGAVIATKLPGEVIATEKLAAEAATGAKINEASLSQVPSANTANFATSAGSSNPEAFAKVSAEGTVFASDSKGIGTAAVKQGKTTQGSYCIEVPFPPKGAQVTPEYNTHNVITAFVHFGGSVNCSAEAAEVQIFSNGSPQKEPFFVLFYR